MLRLVHVVEADDEHTAEMFERLKAFRLARDTHAQAETAYNVAGAHMRLMRDACRDIPAGVFMMDDGDVIVVMDEPYRYIAVHCIVAHKKKERE